MPNIARIGDQYNDGDIQAMGSGNVFINGLPVARLGDLTTGHGCYPPALIQTASPTVFVNGLALARVGDLHTIHCCPEVDCHPGTFVIGSPDVFANESVSGAQPGVSFPDAVMLLQDEEPEPVPLDAADPRQINKNAAYTAAFGKDFFFDNTPPPVLDTNASRMAPTAPTTPKPIQPNVPNSPTVSGDCFEIFQHVGPFESTFQLSPNFTLDMLTTNTIVSNYQLIAQVGLTEAAIVCNLRKLCFNVLEPLLTLYPDLRINSGFRHVGNGAPNSQHFKGQAADISFPSLKTSDDFNTRAEILKNTGLYDQMIYEQNRQTAASTWFHMSYADAKRGSVLTKKAFSDVYLHGIYLLTVN